MRTAIEALFDSMVSDGWANKSGGSVDAPTGHYALMCNERAELFEIRLAFESVTDVYGSPSDDELIGNFIVVTDSAGFIHIYRQPTRGEAERVFDGLEIAFAVWDAA